MFENSLKNIIGNKLEKNQQQKKRYAALYDRKCRQKLEKVRFNHIEDIFYILKNDKQSLHFLFF